MLAPAAAGLIGAADDLGRRIRFAWSSVVRDRQQLLADQLSVGADGQTADDSELEALGFQLPEELRKVG